MKLEFAAQFEVRSSVFFNEVWDTFAVEHVLRGLLSPTSCFFGDKTIAFAALCAWVVAPYDDKLRKAAIIRAVTQELIKIEETGRRKARSDLVIADVTERLSQPNIAAFYEQVYYPIGGLKTITGTLSRPDFAQFHPDSARKVKTALEIAEIYHHHSVYLSSKDKYRSASLSAAARLIRDIGGATKRDGGDAIDNIKKRWRASRPSISLAYAASSMLFKSGSEYSNLLDVMRSGGRALKAPVKVLPRLVGRARYVEEKVLSKTYQNGGDSIDFSGLGVDPIEIQGREFCESERLSIARAFARYPKLG